MWFSTDLYSGFCETLYWGWRGEPLNTTSSLLALAWVIYIYLSCPHHKLPDNVALGCGVLATSGLCSALYHAFLFETFGQLDTNAMTLGGWVAAAIVTQLLARRVLLTLLSLLGSWFLCYSIAVSGDSVDSFMWLLLVPNGLWVVGLPLVIYDKDPHDNRQRWRYAGVVLCAALAITLWTQTERRCQLNPALAAYLFWGHSLFHALAYSAYGLGLLIVRDL
jgi:hypothetical protein